VQGDWEAWNNRSLAADRRALDSRRHRSAGAARQEATSISLLVVLGCARTARKYCWREEHGGRDKGGLAAVLDDLVKRGLRKPELLIVDAVRAWKRLWRPSGRCADAALHGPQASQSARQRPERTA